MSKQAMNTAKTVGIGLVAGTAAMVVGSAMMNKKKSSNGMRSMKKSAGKAVHTVGEIVNSVESMLK